MAERCLRPGWEASPERTPRSTWSQMSRPMWRSSPCRNSGIAARRAARMGSRPAAVRSMNAFTSSVDCAPSRWLTNSPSPFMPKPSGWCRYSRGLPVGRYSSRKEPTSVIRALECAKAAWWLALVSSAMRGWLSMWSRNSRSSSRPRALAWRMLWKNSGCGRINSASPDSLSTVLRMVSR